MNFFQEKWGHMNPYDMHKLFINEYILTRSGTTGLLKRDTSRDKRDIDVIKENHKFLWDDVDVVDSWEKKIAKKYYDRLFKEYCIGDLSLYKENKFGLRWRTEKELIDGKGQFLCGAKHCDEKNDLKTWEVNFGYFEQGANKTALVKLRLCPKCSKKLNHRFKRKEIKRLKDTAVITSKRNHESLATTIQEDITSVPTTSAWETTSQPTSKTEDQQVDEFLQDLFL